jgi:hypothetical protein
MAGKMRFKCLDNRGYTSYSQDVKYNAHEHTVKYAIMRGCGALNEKIDVWKARGVFDYSQNGAAFYIRYSGKNHDPGQMELESSNVTALTG